MPFTENQGVRLHWDEQGEGSAVLLIMGHRFSSRMWYPVIPALAAKHRVIWFDNRGTGESSAPRNATMADLVADATAVLDAAGVDQAHVYGVSMGGVIAQELALRSPERVLSLALGCTTVGSEDVKRASKWRYLLYWVPFRLYADRARKTLYGPAAPAAAVERDIAMLAEDRFDPRGVVAQAKAMASYTTTFDRIAGIDTPALVLHGTADTVVPFYLGEQLAAVLDAPLVAFEGAGHSYFAADTDRANKEVLGLFEAIDHG